MTKSPFLTFELHFYTRVVSGCHIPVFMYMYEHDTHSLPYNFLKLVNSLIGTT